MNYARIYAAFIADRRALEHLVPLLHGYVEKHHILPRAKGGGDGAENIIALTPEDHFFAHLLLAKIHGGEMWAPLKLMSAEHDRRYGRARRLHGFAARAAAVVQAGENSPNFDHTEYTLVHKDGHTVTLRRGDIPARLGVSGTTAYALTTGKISRTGPWSLAGTEVNLSRGVKGEIVQFENLDGRRFAGSKAQFARAQGLGRSKVSRIVRGEHAVEGWRLAGSAAVQKTRVSPNFGKGKLITLRRGAEQITGVRHEIAIHLGVTPDLLSVNVRLLRLGQGRTYKGWCYAGEKEA